MNRVARMDVVAVAMVMLIAVAVGCYACWLNRLYYHFNGPFYDSMFYTNQLWDVLVGSRTSGFFTGVKASGGSTVILPWIEGSALARLLPLSREAGVWLQAIWLLPLLVSLYFYFRKIRGCDVWTALAAAVPFVSIHALYQFDGGLSDFRMDLSLLIFFSLGCVWYLIAIGQKAIWPWIVCGIWIGLAGLMRSTSPVYFAAALGPPMLIRALSSRRFLSGAIVTFVVSMCVCGWFFFIRFEDLRRYYFEWNRDANAHLPWRQAILHARAVAMSIGWPAGLWAIAIGVWRNFVHVRAEVRRRIDWEILWIGAAPALMLIVRGAGLNPFVSMPAVFGIVLWLMFPFSGVAEKPVAVERWYRPFSPEAMFAISLLVLTGVAVGGVGNHIRGQGCLNTMYGHRRVIDRMIADSAKHHLQNFRCTTLQLGFINNVSLTNVQKYEYGAKFFSADAPLPTEPIEWNAVAGNDDHAKVNTIVSLAAQNNDYLLLLDEPSLVHLEQHGFKSAVNSHARQLRDAALASGLWVQVGCPIVASSAETMMIYRRRDLPG